MSEKISCLLDGELSRDELASAWKSLGTEDMNAAERYQLIGALMRDECADTSVRLVKSGLSSRIAERIDQEPRWLLPRQHRGRLRNAARSRSRQPAFLGGFAVAASIAAIAVFVVAPSWLGAPEAVAPPVADVERGAPEEIAGNMDELNALLVEHGEFSGSAGLNGLVAYAKFVTQSSE